MAELMKIGPVGSIGSGKSWDEKGRIDIVQTFIWHTKTSLCSIQFQYSNENGNPVFSDRHGASSEEKIFGNKLFNLVRLDHPSEYITSVSGYYSRDYIASLRIGTNLGEYGPFGGRSGCTYNSEFNFQLGEKARQFGGFHGTANDCYVLSIDIYINPVAPLKKNLAKIKEEKKT